MASYSDVDLEERVIELEKKIKFRDWWLMFAAGALVGHLSYLGSFHGVKLFWFF